MKAILADQQVVGKQGQVVGFDEKGRQQAAEVGGVNLLPGTGNDMKIVAQSTSNGYDIGVWCSYEALKVQTADDSPISTCNKYVRLNLASGVTEYNHRLILEKIPLAKTGKLTISAWARSENGSDIFISFQPFPYTDWSITKSYTAEKTWKRYTHTVDLADAKSDGPYSVQVGLPGAAKDTEQIIDVLLAIQMERGSVATDWSPAPEDLAYKSELAVQSNPNLLDNWYFVGGGSQLSEGRFPINQQGLTEYTGATYTIDRFQSENAFGKVSLDAEGVTFSCEGGDAIFLQKAEPALKEAIIGKTVTISLLTTDGDLYSGTGVVEEGKSFGDVRIEDFATLTIGVLSPIQTFRLSIFNNHDKSSLSVAAVKLELSDHQTLAHQDVDGKWILNNLPNYQQELLKCQRYYWKTPATETNFNPVTLTAHSGEIGSDVYLSCLVTPPMPMRIIPTAKVNGMSNGQTVTVRSIYTGTKITGTISIVVRYTIDKLGLLALRLSNTSGTLEVGRPYEADIELNANL